MYRLKAVLATRDFPLKKPLLSMARLALVIASVSLPAEEETPMPVGDFFQALAQELRSESCPFAAHEPPSLPDVTLPWDSRPGSRFAPLGTITTQAQLETELARMRAKFAPFMADMAPTLPSRPRQELSSFSWRLTPDLTPDDELAAALAGSGAWTTVSIPHYTGPVGKAAAFYRTEIDLKPSLLSQDRLFLHFQAVDYLTDVYVNGQLAGTHEGIFDAFEFDIRSLIVPGRNVILLRVRNDGTPVGAMNLQDGSEDHFGDKLAGFGGPGWDDPRHGWICCPPGFGVWQRCWLEARPAVYLNDLYVRPLPNRTTAEVWAEIGGVQANQNAPADMQATCAVFGQNFQHVAVPQHSVPIALDAETVDTFTCPQPATATTSAITVRRFRFTIDLPNAKPWSTEAPWLYQLQVHLARQGQPMDAAKRQFGMRTLTQSTTSTPKGRLFFNDAEIRLRGANMMGNLLQCVMRHDDTQLVDDLLLAKIAHMNFWRMTQQPCPEEVFDRFDQLGMMSQADLPTFIHIPRSKSAEFIRQAGALLRIVRGHACNALISYINEPIGAKTYRHTGGVPRLTVPETLALFRAADALIPQVAPGQVRKWVEGNYQLQYPDECIDHHAYPLWYGPLGQFRHFYLGGWERTTPGWMYSCGEYGTEGVDTPEFLRKYFPTDMLGTTVNGTWTPTGMPNQTARPGYRRWVRPYASMDAWCANSREFQRCATRLMVDAWRRNPHLNSTALHLLIDAWPSGWAKSVMDYERHAKPAYFAFREAQTPLAVNLRPDCYLGVSGGTIPVAVFISNDTQESATDAILRYQLEQGDTILATGQTPAQFTACEPCFQGWIPIPIPTVTARTTLILRVSLFDRTGTPRHDREVELEAFPTTEAIKTQDMPGGWWEYLTQPPPATP